MMETSIKDIFVLETDGVASINHYDVINEMAICHKPIVWCNYGQYRCVPTLQATEYVRLYAQWYTASKRQGGIDRFEYSIHWDDCTVIDAATVKLLLGKDGLEESHDTGTDNTDA